MTDAIQYDGGLTVGMPVASLDTAIDWYQRILGFELLYRMDDIGWCELVSPIDKVNVGLSVVEEPNPGGATPTFGVKDIEAARSVLEENSVRLDGDIMTIDGMVRLQTFYDLDNNALMFFQDISSND